MSITSNLELCCKTRSDNDMSTNRNKENLKRSTGQKLTKSKEKLRSVCNSLLSEYSLTVEQKPPVLMADTSFSKNASTSSSTQEPPEELQNHDNSVSNLDEELLLVLIIYIFIYL